MKAFFTICLIFLFSGGAFSQASKAENTSTLNPTGCATLFPTSQFVICADVVTTITPVMHTIGSAPYSFDWAIPPFANVLGGTGGFELVTYSGGSYTITVSNANTGCSAVMIYTVVVCADVGINELTATDPVVSMYPNPCIDQLSIELKEAATIQLFSSSGALMYSGDLTPGINKLDVRDLAKGLYYARVSTGSGSRAFKLIKE